MSPGYYGSRDFFLWDNEANKTDSPNGFPWGKEIITNLEKHEAIDYSNTWAPSTFDECYDSCPKTMIR